MSEDTTPAIVNVATMFETVVHALAAGAPVDEVAIALAAANGTFLAEVYRTHNIKKQSDRKILARFVTRVTNAQSKAAEIIELWQRRDKGEIGDSVAGGQTVKRLQHRYSRGKSKKFWRRIKTINGQAGRDAYAIACDLQNHEEQALLRINDLLQS